MRFNQWHSETGYKNIIESVPEYIHMREGVEYHWNMAMN